MRFVVSIVLFVAAFVLVGVGVAQRTIWAAPDQVTLSSNARSDAPVTVIDGRALQAHPGRPHVVITGSGQMTAAYGRSSDVEGWIGDASYNSLTLSKSGRLVAKTVSGSDATVPALSGADLWLNDFTASNRLGFDLDVPDDYSVIIEADGTAAAPTDVSITWPANDQAPYSAPLILGGLVLLLLGLVTLIWAIVHLYNSRGPRRRQPRLPRPPRAPRYRTRRVAQSPRRRTVTRAFIALPVALLGVGLVAGPAAAARPTAVDESTKPAVTVSQVKKIVERLSDTVAKADETHDATLAATRLGGDALAFRQANYQAFANDNTIGALPAIPKDVVLTLPQQTDTWPRTVFTVVKTASDPKAATVALMLQQEDARSSYKAVYVSQLEPNTVVPDVAAATTGAPRLQDDVKILSVAPRDLATHYADVLLNGKNSTYAGEFDLDHDGLLPAIGPDAKAQKKSALPTTASIEFGDAAASGEVISFATSPKNFGAIVAVSVTDSETIKPTQQGATVTPSGTVKALSGKASSTKGFTSTYGVQLLFFVPAITTGDASASPSPAAAEPTPSATADIGDGKVKLLGFSTSLVSAAELP